MRRRQAADLQELKENSRRILEKVCCEPRYQEAKILLAYVDAKREVETRELICQAWKDGKRVAVPRTFGGGVMHFYEIHSLEELEPGGYGILEPKKDCPLCETEEGLMLMPGVAFDEKAHRVGYGGGYYDRYLEQHPGLVHIALAFEFQIFKEVPFQEHDILPELIVTEKRLIRP